MARALLTAAILYTPIMLAYAAPIWGGGRVTGGILELSALSAAISLIVAVGAFPFLLWRRARARALSTLVFCGIVWLIFYPMLYAATQLRSYGFHLVAQRAQPIIAAVEAHIAKTGAAPARLEELIPNYLSAMPDKLPPLKIVVGDAAQKNYYGNEWVLTAAVGTGMLNFDRFIYLPNQKYPVTRDWERIERWAYLHE